MTKLKTIIQKMKLNCFSVNVIFITSQCNRYTQYQRNMSMKHNRIEYILLLFLYQKRADKCHSIDYNVCPAIEL